MEITINIWTLVTWGLILVVVSFVFGWCGAIFRTEPAPPPGLLPDDYWGDDA